MNSVAIKLAGDRYRLGSEFHDSSQPTAKRHYPATTIRSFPVCCQGGLPSDVPALLQVVVDEILKQKLINGRPAAGTSYRPHIVEQHTQCPVPRLHQRNGRRPNSKLALSKKRACGCG